MIFPFGRPNSISHGWTPWKKSDANIFNGDTMLNQDFKEFIRLLNKNNVQYLVVGGYTVALHGYPRHTKSLDIWINRNPENAGKMMRALDEFGFGSLDLKSADFLEPDQIIQLGYPPNRIDIITSASGVEFEACFESKLTVTLENQEVYFIDRENLKKVKKATGRFQDLADLENLQ
jgi:hypothetical protein